MKAHRFLPFAAAAMLAAGCTSAGNSKAISGGTDAWYAVAASQTPFYHYGPQQGNGPDMQLPHDSIMQVIRPSFGFVKVKLQNGERGYVASEDIRPAGAALVAEKLAPPPDPPAPVVAGYSEQGERFRFDSDDPRLIAPPEPLPEEGPSADFRYEPAPLPDQ